MRRLLAAFVLVSGLFLSAAPAFAQPVPTCGDLSTLSPDQQTTANNAATASGSPFSSFACQRLTGSVSASDRSQNCVSGLCPGGTDVMCCSPGIGGRVGTGGTTGGTASTGGSFFRLQLPACIQTGDCSLDDIVRTGVNFANFLFGLSGAILLATFVYGGVLYITAGSGGNVGRAKDMIKNALIGMILVFGAGALVTTVYDTFRSDTGGGADACTTAHPTYSCQYLTASVDDAAAQQAEMTRRGCIPGLCAGDTTRRCCPNTAP
ncbi:MAG TPA: pilin [Verrucomicrobiae bacterium]|nr:pilin [Verrucomicrobiae bacterium]